MAMAQAKAGAVAAPPPAAADQASTVGEVIVTAEKRSVNVQKVPVAVTAFTSKERALEGIGTVQEITDFTPGLTYSSQLDRPVIRGLARNNNIYLSDSAVAVYYDDFFSNSTFLVGRDDMLIDQVEILLGPQGTLYGRNAVGGLINTISKRPTNDLTGEVRAIAGNFGYTKFEGTISGPIPLIDGLTFRLSGYDLNQSKGYFTNVAGGPTEGDVRHDPYVDLQLQYKDDKNDIWLDSYVLGFNHDRGGPGSLLGTPETGPYDGAEATGGQLVFNPNFPFSGHAVPGSVVGQVPGLTNNPALNNIRDFAHAIPTDITLNAAFAFNFHWTHHFDGFDVKYVGGYSQYHYDLHTSYFNNDNSSITQFQIPLAPGGACASGALGPCSPLTVFPNQVFTYETNTRWYSHELDFTSTNDGPVDWIAGLYRYDEIDNNPTPINDPQQPQIAHPGFALTAAGLPTAVLPNPSGDSIFLDYQDHIMSTAGFGQVGWKITDTLKFTVGLRYTYDQKVGTEETRFIAFQDLSAATSAENLGKNLPAADITQTLIAFGAQKGVTRAPTLNTNPNSQFFGDFVASLGDTSDAVTGTARLEFTPDRDTLAYIAYNRGYKAFGFNAGFDGHNAEALPESVNDFEVGYKRNIGRTLQISADAFYYDYRDDQIPIGVVLAGANGGPSTTVTEFINIPRSISEGFELTANWTPIDHLNLSFVYGFDDTSIQSGCTLVNGVATGTCLQDAADPAGAAQGARPVGPLIGGNAVQAVKGDPLPQSPKNRIAFNANYTWVFDPGNFTASASYIWKDKSFAGVFNRTYDEAPSWNQVDLRGTWSGNHDKYEIVLYVKNLFNTLGYDAASGAYRISAPVGGGPLTQGPSFDLTPPRLYGIEVHYKF